MDGNSKGNRINEEVGSWLRASRLRAQMTLAEAARAIERHPEGLRQVEVAGRGIPFVDLAKLVKLYNVSSEELVQKILGIQFPRQKPELS